MNLLANLGTNVAIAFVAALLAILLYLLWLWLRNPVLVKLGVRNIPRRPTQSVLIVIGLALSTIIIVSALSTGDTLTYSLRRQAVAAYGEVDEILAPPFLSLLVSLSGESNFAEPNGIDPDATAAEPAVSENQQALENLTAGGLTSVLTVLEGGLPGITTARYEQLRAEAAAMPFVDRVAASILFPTIIRNTTTGQGEPLGFIFAVDNDYDQSFGLTTVEGQPVTMEALKPGVGNIFAQASNLFGMAGDLAQRAGLDLQISDVALATAAVGAALTAAPTALTTELTTELTTGTLDLNQLRIPLDTIDQLGIDTTPLREEGLTELSLAALGVTTDTLASLGVTTTTLSLADLGLDSTLPFTENLLNALNLNTLGGEIDRVLAQVGLQLRQGDVYLNRLGAEQLNARVGDVLDVYIGPIPIPFRVKAIVEEAGPLGALFPVVMLRLDEAQQLLFMNGKVNNVLVSNLGDELSGVEHTAAVSQQLRVLAMDESALAEVVAILRRPDVQPLLVGAAADAQSAVMEDFNGPQFLADLIQDLSPLGGMLADLNDFAGELEKPVISDRLREILANTALRGWLIEQPLPADAKSALTAALGDLNTFDVIDPLSKATLLTVGNAAGGIFASIFSLFGFFSILAGILLIFLIFVMLATERRSEMGMARAIGVQRRHLVQMFVVEGMLYDLVAAALGVLLGLAVTYAMVDFLGDIFNNLTAQVSSQSTLFTFRFHAAPTSMVIAYCVGVLLTFVVVSFSAWRVSRLNIVSAIRDLPEESEESRRSWLSRLWKWGSALALALLGGYLLQLGLQSALLSLLLVGATFALIGLSLFTLRVLEPTRWRTESIHRWCYTVMGLGLLLLWAVPWSRVLPQWSDNPIFQPSPDQTLFTLALGGPLIILGAILTVTFNASALTWFVGFVLGGIGQLTPVLKTAIAYPLSARFRTGMAMLMFAMIISTVVVMAVVIRATQTIVVLDEKETAGFDIRADTTLLSFFAPLRDMEAQIAALQAAANDDYPLLAAVETVGAYQSQFVELRNTSNSLWYAQFMAGLSDGYLRQAETVYHFQSRAAGFADDAAVWQALRERTDVAIVTPNLVAAVTDGPESRRFENSFRLPVVPAGEPLPPLFVEIRSADTDAGAATTPRTAHRVQIIGVLDDATTLAARSLQVNWQALGQITAEAPQPSQFYVKVQPGADVRAVAQAVERAFLGNGINAVVLAESFAQGQAFTRGILQLFQGFMALGLLVGIAALGVITSRTVVERRQQIGMLRAIGYQARMIALSFVLEASFIAITGMLIGTITGIVLGESLVQSFFVSLTPETTFTLPWGQIGLILLITYGFSLLTAIVPAYQAARTYPAEALRYE
ncbi:MAG: FtsX-like permease family protein [Caldilineaceae bacterium]|nr:FtsX-like permease family protein [Caldilineaceae bacterium]